MSVLIFNYQPFLTILSILTTINHSTPILTTVDNPHQNRYQHRHINGVDEMKHHLIVIYDDKGVPLEIIRYQGKPVVVPYEFDSLGAAETYRQQLFASLGMEPRALLLKGGAKGKRKHVKDCQTGEVYPSAAAAARAAFVSPSAVMKYLRNPIGKNAARGKTWEYV